MQSRSWISRRLKLAEKNVIEYVLVLCAVGVLISLIFPGTRAEMMTWFHGMVCYVQKGSAAADCGTTSAAVTRVAPAPSSTPPSGGGGGISPPVPTAPPADPPGFADIVVYYDARYPSAWTSNSSQTASSFASSAGYPTYSASKLRDWMDNYLNNPNGKYVVLMSQDICPDTVCNLNMDSDSLIRRFMNAGGTVVWTGDIPFYYLGHTGGAKDTIGGPGQVNLLGVEPNNATNYTNQSAFTYLGNFMGLTFNHSSLRTQPPRGIVPLTNEPDGNAGSWFKNYNADYPRSGFYRYLDAYFDGSNVTMRAELDKIINYLKNPPPIDIGPIWTKPGYNASVSTGWVPATDEGLVGVLPWVPVNNWPDPSAHWMWSSYTNNSSAPSGSIYLRRQFSVPSAAVLRISATADNRFKLYVDGIPVYTQWEQEVPVGTPAWQQTFQVNVFVGAGNHVIASEAYNHLSTSAAGFLVSVANSATNQTLVNDIPGWLTHGYTSP